MGQIVRPDRKTLGGMPLRRKAPCSSKGAYAPEAELSLLPKSGPSRAAIFGEKGIFVGPRASNVRRPGD
jgi:hypothetical protein